MSHKRSLIPDVYRTRKRVCSSANNGANNSDASSLANDSLTNDEWDNHDNHMCWSSTDDNANLPNDTKTALLYLKNLFPMDKFEGRLPPIILKHQIYGIIKNRTLVDKDVADLRNSGEIRLFKLGSDASEFCIVFTEDYKSHVLRFTSDLSISKSVIDKYLTSVVTSCQDICLNKQKMMHEFHFKDDEITQLVKAGVLTVREVGSWWLAIPSAGLYMKSFIRGRKAVLTMIRKSKYKEILQTELGVRKLPKVARLGMTYHIHDIIGADLVECVSTSSGQLLRLRE